MSTSLLVRIAAGDRAAVPELMARYGGLVWSLAQRMMHNPADAEEAVQEIFIDLWRTAERFDERIASEPTFIAMIARRRLIDTRRKLDRRVTTSSIAVDVNPPSPETFETSDSPWGEDVTWARQQLAQLRPIERRVIELVIDHGLSHSQISETLQMPLGTVKSTARRGLMRLRELCLHSPPQHCVEGASDHE